MPGLEARRVLLGDLEPQQHRIALEDRREHRAGLEVLALLHGAGLDDAGDRRAHRRVAQVELGDLQRLLARPRRRPSRCRPRSASARSPRRGRGRASPSARRAGARARPRRPSASALAFASARLAPARPRSRSARSRSSTSASPCLDLLALDERDLVDRAGDARGDLHLLERVDRCPARSPCTASACASSGATSTGYSSLPPPRCAAAAGVSDDFVHACGEHAATATRSREHALHHGSSSERVVAHRLAQREVRGRDGELRLGEADLGVEPLLVRVDSSIAFARPWWYRIAVSSALLRDGVHRVLRAPTSACCARPSCARGGPDLRVDRARERGRVEVGDRGLRVARRARRRRARRRRRCVQRRGQRDRAVDVVAARRRVRRRAELPGRAPSVGKNRMRGSRAKSCAASAASLRATRSGAVRQARARRASSARRRRLARSAASSAVGGAQRRRRPAR